MTDNYDFDEPLGTEETDAMPKVLSQWLDARDERLDALSRLPEAGGSVNIYIYFPSGAKGQVTARGRDGIEALENLAAALAYARLAYDAKTVPGAAPKSEPAGQSAQNGQEEYIPDQGDVTPAAAPAVTSTAASAVTSTAASAATPATHPTGAIPEFSFPCQTLSASVLSGKPYWSIFGGRFTKFGVRIWPEVWQRAGFAELDTTKTYNLHGYTAHYIAKTDEAGQADPGKPVKVVRLEKAAA